jgi:hypothetical protein
VCPSAAITGSTITSRVNEHRYSLGRGNGEVVVVVATAAVVVVVGAESDKTPVPTTTSVLGKVEATISVLTGAGAVARVAGAVDTTPW